MLLLSAHWCSQARLVSMQVSNNGWSSKITEERWDCGHHKHYPSSLCVRLPHWRTWVPSWDRKDLSVHKWAHREDEMDRGGTQKARKDSKASTAEAPCAAAWQTQSWNTQLMKPTKTTASSFSTLILHTFFQFCYAGWFDEPCGVKKCQHWDFFWGLLLTTVSVFG